MTVDPSALNGVEASRMTAPAPASEGVPRFALDRDRGERIEAINRLYNDFTGRQRSVEAYRWEFYQTPSGPGLVWTITETASGKLVGHHGLVRTPVYWGGETIAAARTENTIVAHDYRRKVFYPGMEKRALTEAQAELRVTYTVDATIPGALRKRFGYKAVGRWWAFLPKIGPAYLRGLLSRARAKVAPWCPDWLLGVGARLLSIVLRATTRGAVETSPLEVVEIGDLSAVAAEYETLWASARDGYDVTIDRSLAFLRWRCVDNPHLDYRTWALRRDGKLHAVVIGHLHQLGGGSSLYIDDIIVADYEDAAFDAVVNRLASLDSGVDSVVLMTLAVDTPLSRVLKKRYPLQAWLLSRYSDKMFGEMMVFDSAEVLDRRVWYATALFTEGMDTSRPSLG